MILVLVEDCTRCDLGPTGRLPLTTCETLHLRPSRFKPSVLHGGNTVPCRRTPSPPDDPLLPRNFERLRRCEKGKTGLSFQCPFDFRSNPTLSVDSGLEDRTQTVWGSRERWSQVRGRGVLEEVSRRREG